LILKLLTTDCTLKCVLHYVFVCVSVCVCVLTLVIAAALEQQFKLSAQQFVCLFLA